MKETFKIRTLEQVRLLSDPLKLRILQAFAENVSTTKQVAVELGENTTKLYRHVDALYDAGLLEIAAEKQKRGTIERTFRAVAKRFEADQALFTDKTDERGAGAAREMLRSVEDEIITAIENTHEEDDREAILMRLRFKASPERIAELHASLTGWCESVQMDDDHPGENTEEVGALIAFYPIS